MSDLRDLKYSHVEGLRQETCAGDTDFGIIGIFMVTKARKWTKSPKERVSVEMRRRLGHNPKD